MMRSPRCESIFVRRWLFERISPTSTTSTSESKNSDTETGERKVPLSNRPYRWHHLRRDPQMHTCVTLQIHLLKKYEATCLSQIRTLQKVGTMRLRRP